MEGTSWAVMWPTNGVSISGRSMESESDSGPRMYPPSPSSPRGVPSTLQLQV